MNRIAILIDGNNFYKGCQLNFSRTDVDFRRLGQKLSTEIDGELLRIYYYNAHVSKSIDPLGYQRQQKFFDNLRVTPYITLKLGHLVYHRLRNDQGFSSQYFPTEKGIDVQIAVDMIRLALLKACDGIILVSGDSDYIYAVRFVKDLGANVYVASFPMGGSAELRNEGDGAIVMDLEFLRDCFIRAQQYQRNQDTEQQERIVDTVATTYQADRYRNQGGYEDNRGYQQHSGPQQYGNQSREPQFGVPAGPGYPARQDYPANGPKGFYRRYDNDDSRPSDKYGDNQGSRISNSYPPVPPMDKRDMKDKPSDNE